MQSKELKLNLGCGRRILQGYVNIDSNPFEDKVTVMDVRNLMYADDSVDEILAEFILEHIPYYQIQETILEWWRVLRPGGTLVLWVPDFDEIARAWLDGEISRTVLHYQLYCPMLNPEKQMPHFQVFDKKYLRELLTQEGFEIQFMTAIGTDVKVTAKKKLEKEGTCR